MNNNVNPEFWNGKRVFLTGHTGFKGSWLSIWLNEMGAIVKGYALAPETSPALFIEAKIDDLIESEIGDIRDLDSVSKSMKAFNPDVLIHMAAQPLVRLSYREPVDTYAPKLFQLSWHPRQGYHLLNTQNFYYFLMKFYTYFILKKTLNIFYDFI
mgnify:CR=1 FL=1